MLDAAFTALYLPPLLLAGMVISLSLPFLLPASAAIALITGIALGANDHNRAIRWFVLPVVVTHIFFFLYKVIGLPGWWIGALLWLASLIWLLRVCRESLWAGIFLAYFCAVYFGVAAAYAWTAIYA